MNRPGNYTYFDPAPDSSHNLVMGLVPPGARVLEFGCATGYMSEALKTRLGCSVTGVELFAEAAEYARAHCNRVILGDAENLDFNHLLGADRFDAILFADVLEHLRDPGAVLVRVRPFLADDGAVIASIPNVAHGSVRLALLHGEFRYRDVGLLDRTHLRFFTRDSIQDLFEASGYVVTHWLRRRKGIAETEIHSPGRPAPQSVLELLAADPEATTYQFVVRAAPSSLAPVVHDLKGRLTAVGSELAAVRAELAAARAKLMWNDRVLQMVKEINSLISPGETFLLVDDDQIGAGFFSSRTVLPFPEQDGKYGGPPSDDASAVREFERLRQYGAGFMVFAFPAFWWLDYYPAFHSYLRGKYHCALENDRLVVFDVRSGT
jgi:2-polyprenyl-3-methyl-5-hydroxy-6-metoxy-1,4-benzoquinol methylase